MILVMFLHAGVEWFLFWDAVKKAPVKESLWMKKADMEQWFLENQRGYHKELPSWIRKCRHHGTSHEWEKHTPMRLFERVRGEDGHRLTPEKAFEQIGKLGGLDVGNGVDVGSGVEETRKFDLPMTNEEPVKEEKEMEEEKEPVRRTRKKKVSTRKDEGESEK